MEQYGLGEATIMVNLEMEKKNLVQVNLEE